MAIVKFVTSKCPINRIFPYVMNLEKTDEKLISGINCMPETAIEEFNFVKKQFRKEDGRTFVHIVQSFSPDDPLTPETAHEIGLRFAEYFPGYQILVATHKDKEHIHNHIIMNSVNFENGKKFHQSKEELKKVKAYANSLCREYGLSETEEKSSFGSMPNWKKSLRNMAYKVACRTRTREEFIEEMELHGYTVAWKEGQKYITFTTPDGHKCRDNKLFAEQLLRKNLEIYYLLGGCDSPLAEEYKNYFNKINPNVGYTVGTGLFELFESLLTVMPEEGYFSPPAELGEMDKLTVMELEALGIKVEPKAFLKYSVPRGEEENTYGFYI